MGRGAGRELGGELALWCKEMLWSLDVIDAQIRKKHLVTEPHIQVEHEHVKLLRERHGLVALTIRICARAVRRFNAAGRHVRARRRGVDATERPVGPRLADLDSELIVVMVARAARAARRPTNSSMNASSPDSTTATLSTTHRNTRPPLDDRCARSRLVSPPSTRAVPGAPRQRPDAAESRSRAARTADQAVGGSLAGSASTRAAKSAARVAWSSACAWRRAASLSCRYRSRVAESSLASSCSTTFLASASPVA